MDRDDILAEDLAFEAEQDRLADAEEREALFDALESHRRGEW